MQSILRGDDEEFAVSRRYYRAAPASSQEQYHVRNQHGNHHRALGSMQMMPQYQQQPKSVFHMQAAAHERLQNNRGGSTQQQRGDFRFRRGGHRMVSTHDSNDEDGETSSASEDSATSAGYPSPPLARPASATLRQSGKRAQPSASFCLPPAQRSRIQPQKSDHDAPLQAGWSPDMNITNELAAGVACGARDSPRQLPRLAALERLPKQGGAAQKNQQEHDRNAYTHTSTTAPPMQLPPLLGAARQVPNSTSSSSATSCSPLSSPTMHSVSSSSSGPPSPPQRAAQQQQQQQHHQHQLSRPVPQHSALHNNNAPRSIGRNHHWQATATMIHGRGGGVEHAQWLPSGEKRHVPRIDGLCAAAATAPLSARGLPHLQQWGSGSGAWSKQTPGSSRPFEHNAGYDGTYNNSSSDGRMEEERGWARQRGDWREAGAWTREKQPEHHVDGYLQRGPDERRHGVQPKGVQHPEASSRAPSPTYRQQVQPPSPPSPPASVARASQRASTKRAWKSPEDSLAPGTGENPSGDWANGGQHPSGTVGKQILQQYLAHLNPKASREVWSHDEEEVLWRAQKEYGNAWSYIAGLLPGRSENAVKNHWYTQMRMFIGQRGNNNSSSSSSGKLSTCAPSTDSSSSTSDKGSIAMSNKAARPSRTQKKQEEDRAEARQRAESALPADVVPLANAASVAAARAEAERLARAEDEARLENVARAEAVAALGMLFSQNEGSSSGDESSSSSRMVASRPLRDVGLPGFCVGVTSRA